MARPRKIKRRSRKHSPSVSFLPESLQAFVARRMIDSMALLFLGVSAFMAASLVSYNRNDPSWNTASDEAQQISNWGGHSGAWLSDVLLQTLGAGAFVLTFGFAFWGVRIFKRQSVRPLTLRFAALLVATLLGSVALAQIPSGNWTVHPYLGSSAGTLVLNYMVGLSSALHIPYGHQVFANICGVIALGIFLYAAAFTRDDVATMWFRVKATAYIAISSIAAAMQGFYNWTMHYNDDAYKPESALTGIMDRIRTMRDERAERRAALAEEPEEEYEEEEETAEDDEEYEGGDEEYEEEEAAEDDEEEEEEAVSYATIPVVKPDKADKKNAAKKGGKKPAQQALPMVDSDAEWEFPPAALIQDVPPETLQHKLDEAALRRNAELLKNVLADYNVKGEIVKIHPGPVVTLYEFEPAPGIKSSRIISLSDDIARSMSAISVRCAVVPGRSVIGIELPNKVRQTVYMREMLESRLYEKTTAKLPLILGKDISGQPILADLAKMPHLLVAGTTGSGKSVAVNTMIMSLLFRLSPQECRFIMIDPKMLELSVYDDIPHLLSPVVTEPGKAVVALKWAVMEMENRYRNMSKLGVRNIEGYNQRIKEALKKDEEIMHKVQTGFDPESGKPVFEDQPLTLAELPYIVVIVDEFADLMLVAGKDVENAIQRLAQMARAAGIHLIMATQRPSVDVITGVVKANFPTRISFQVTSKIDSRTILQDGGAEQLLGMGDMLYMAPGGRITRVHGPFVSDEDVEKTTTFLKSQATPSYLDGITDEDGFSGGSEVMAAMFGGGSSSDDNVDELYDKAVAIIAREGKVSTSFIQRHLQIGYNRAARIVEEMERQGVISPANAVGKRHILISDHSRV